MKIEIYRKNVYGNELVYLIDSEPAQHVQALTGQKTLSDWARRHLEALGFSFEEVLAPRAA